MREEPNNRFSGEEGVDDPLGDLLARYVFLGVRRATSRTGDAKTLYYEAYERVKDVLLEFFGEGVASVIFYRLGEHDGGYFGRHTGIRLGDLERMVESLSTFSMFNVVEVGLRESSVRIVVDNLIDRNVGKPYVKGEGGGVGCYYTRGFLKRLVEMVVGEEVRVKETRCGVGLGLSCEYFISWGGG